AIDQRLGDAIAQIIGISAAANVAKWQHGDGIYALGGWRQRIATDDGRDGEGSDAGGEDPKFRVRLCRRRSGNRNSLARFGFALQPLEIGAQLTGAAIAQLAIFFQKLVNNALQLDRNIWIEADWRGGRRMQD